MKIAPRMVLAASAIAITGSLGMVGSAAQAAPVAEQCPAGLGKVETDGTSASVYTGLAPGTSVCLKAGTSVTWVTVDEFGYITNSVLLNQNGNAKGISNYVWYTYTPPSS